MNLISIEQYKLDKEKDIAEYSITGLQYAIKNGDLDLFQLMIIQQQLAEISRTLMEEYNG